MKNDEDGEEREHGSFVCTEYEFVDSSNETGFRFLRMEEFRVPHVILRTSATYEQGAQGAGHRIG